MPCSRQSCNLSYQTGNTFDFIAESVAKLLVATWAHDDDDRTSWPAVP